MTMMDGMVNLHYKEDADLASDLVTCINQELVALVKAGCTHVQIDEPVMMRYPDKALSFGLDNLDKCLKDIPDNVTKVCHHDQHNFDDSLIVDSSSLLWLS